MDDIRRDKNSFLTSMPINADEIFTFKESCKREKILFNPNPQITWDLTQGRFHGQMKIEDEFKEHSETMKIITNDIGFEINRDILHNEMIESGIYSSYEPCIYPGVNIKYFINKNQFDGICCCESMCNGKGRADGDGNCKKVTIAVFKSGKIIITGGQNIKQLETSYRFIKNFIEERKELFVLK